MAGDENQLPQRVHGFLEQITDLSARKELKRLFLAICDVMHRSGEHKEQWRTYRSVSATMMNLVLLLRPVVEKAGGWAGCLSLLVSLETLMNTLAMAFIQWYRTSYSAQTRQTLYSSETTRGILKLMRSAIAKGAFPCIAPENHPRVVHAQVRLYMKRLSEEQPGEWSFRVPANVHASTPSAVGRDINAEEVNRLMAVAEPRDALMVTVLCNTGLRAEAIASLRWSDVWDMELDRPRSLWNVIEKGSKCRSIAISNRICEDLIRYRLHLTETSVPCAGWIFGSPGSKRAPIPRTMRNHLQTLADRAGLPDGITVHSFRRFVVNNAMSNGARLNDISSFLGHDLPANTYRYYWTNGVHDEVNRVLDTDEGDAMDSLKVELKSLEAEIDSVRRDLLDLQHIASAPVQVGDNTVCEMDVLLRELQH